jgi:hypothetical protein
MISIKIGISIWIGFMWYLLLDVTHSEFQGCKLVLWNGTD